MEPVMPEETRPEISVDQTLTDCKKQSCGHSARPGRLPSVQQLQHAATLTGCSDVSPLIGLRCVVEPDFVAGDGGILLQLFDD